MLAHPRSCAHLRHDKKALQKQANVKFNPLAHPVTFTQRCNGRFPPLVTLLNSYGHQFVNIEEASEKLIEKLPGFSDSCSTFTGEAADISKQRGLNSLTLKHYAQITEILEIPHLMDTFVRNAYYEEALQLQAHVARWHKKYGAIAVIASIATDVEHCARQMLVGLLQQLEADVQLPACLRIIGYLRRLEAFDELQLRVQFLQVRSPPFSPSLCHISIPWRRAAADEVLAVLY
jgi:hypothetical protein